MPKDFKVKECSFAVSNIMYKNETCGRECRSKSDYLGGQNIKPAEFGLHAEAEGPEHPHHSAEVVPHLVVAVQFPRVEGLPFNQIGYLVSVAEVLVTVPGVSPLEVVEKIIETPLALQIRKPVFQQEVDEHDIGLCPYPIDLSTFVNCLDWVQVFCCPVRDYLFSGGVVLSPGVAVGVGDCSGMMSGFVVVTLCVEPEEPVRPPDPLIVLLEVFPLVQVRQV